MESKSQLKVGMKVRFTGDREYFGVLPGQEFTIDRIDVDGDPWAGKVCFEYEQLDEVGDQSQDTKATNPKDAIGSTKLPLNLVPDTLPVMAALAFTEGATKYGAFNWRVAGVRASIYEAALKRHMAKWWNGEDADPVTGVPHLASVIACAGIILDAALAGKLTDDRPPKVPMGELIDSFESKVKHLKELHKDKNPHHHTALD